MKVQRFFLITLEGLFILLINSCVKADEDVEPPKLTVETSYKTDDIVLEKNVSVSFNLTYQDVVSTIQSVEIYDMYNESDRTLVDMDQHEKTLIFFSSIFSESGIKKYVFKAMDANANVTSKMITVSYDFTENEIDYTRAEPKIKPLAGAYETINIKVENPSGSVQVLYEGPNGIIKALSPNPTNPLLFTYDIFNRIINIADNHKFSLLIDGITKNSTFYPVTTKFPQHIKGIELWGETNSAGDAFLKFTREGVKIFSEVKTGPSDTLDIISHTNSNSDSFNLASPRVVNSDPSILNLFSTITNFSENPNQSLFFSSTPISQIDFDDENDIETYEDLLAAKTFDTQSIPLKHGNVIPFKVFGSGYQGLIKIISINGYVKCEVKYYKSK